MAFRVPIASLSGLETIVKAYTHKPGPNKTVDIARATKLSVDDVSRSIKFLEDLGILTGGNEKAATPLGVSLGRALDHNRGTDAESFWRRAVKQNETLTDALTNLRISGGSSEEDLAGDILYKAGLQANPRNKKGARNAVEILKKAGLVEVEGDNLVLAQTSRVLEQDQGEEDDQGTGNAGGGAPLGASTAGALDEVAEPLTPSIRTIYRPAEGPTIAINIQLELPPATDPVVYDNLFRSLAEHLLPKQDRRSGDDD